MLKNTTLGCLFLAVTAAPALAQGPAEAKIQKFVLEPGAIEMGDLIDRTASYLGWNILVNPQELAHCADQFKLQNRIETDRNGCEDLVTTMLATRGVVVRTLDQGKNLYEVVALQGPRGRECMSSAPQRSAEDILARPNLRMPVATVLHLKHINANLAVNSMRPFFATNNGQNYLTFGTAGSPSSLMITGMQDQVATAIRLVMQSDVAQEEPAQQPGQQRVPQAQSIGAQMRSLQKRIKEIEKAISARKEK